MTIHILKDDKPITKWTPAFEEPEEEAGEQKAFKFSLKSLENEIALEEEEEEEEDDSCLKAESLIQMSLILV